MPVGPCALHIICTTCIVHCYTAGPCKIRYNKKRLYSAIVSLDTEALGGGQTTGVLKDESLGFVVCNNASDRVKVDRRRKQTNIHVCLSLCPFVC